MRDHKIEGAPTLIPEEPIQVSRGKHTFSVNVGAQAVSGPDNPVASLDDVTYEGYFTYVVGGKERRMDLSGKAALAKGVRGDAVTYAEVRKTSERGAISLQIMVDGITIYESGWSDKPEALMYSGSK